MSIEVKVPMLPESVADAVVAKWYKAVGETINRDENIVDLETDKVMLEVPAPVSGTVKEIKFQEGDTVNADQILAIIEEGDVAAPAAEKTQAAEAKTTKEVKAEVSASKTDSDNTGPAARRALKEADLSNKDVAGSGRGGRVTKNDVLNAASGAGRRDERVPMTRIRLRTAERLKEVQNTAALLTTFNEVNMKPIMDLRKKYKDQFEKEHDSRLGFMSFFVKASIEAQIGRAHV